MTTTIQITKVGDDSYAVGVTMYNVAGGLGYISFSCNDEAFFEYFGGGVVFTKPEINGVEMIKYYDAEGVELYCTPGGYSMVWIIQANPQAIAKAVYQNITGQEYPGGDVSVIFPNNN
jgi:hypothetical protein